MYSSTLPFWYFCPCLVLYQSTSCIISCHTAMAYKRLTSQSPVIFWRRLILKSKCCLSHLVVYSLKCLPQNADCYSNDGYTSYATEVPCFLASHCSVCKQVVMYNWFQVSEEQRSCCSLWSMWQVDTHSKLWSYYRKTTITGLVPSSCARKGEREPGTHCLHMHQIPLVSCILLLLRSWSLYPKGQR